MTVSTPGPARPTPVTSVGIVMRTKDRAVLLRRALRSVLGQSHFNWKLVIVNDGGAPEPVDALVAAHPDPRVQVLHHPRSLGMEAASNAGMRKLDTELLVIHDDDDSWAPEFLAVCVAELARLAKTLPSVHGVATYSNRVLERVEGSTVRIEQLEPFNLWAPPGLLSFDRVLYENFIPPISFVFRRESAEAIGCFRESLPVLGDWDFLVRFMKHHDVYLIPEVLAFYHHRMTSTGAMGNSVIDGNHQHHLYRNVLLNEWLRSDFSGDGGGLGLYANLRTELERLRREGAVRDAKIEEAIRRTEDLQKTLYEQVIPDSREPVIRLKDIQETLYEQLLPKLNQTLTHVERLVDTVSRVKKRVSNSVVNRLLLR